MVKFGDKSELVRAMQAGLNKKGATPKLAEDGVFGALTLKAVFSFVEKEPDGYKVGIDLYKKIIDFPKSLDYKLVVAFAKKHKIEPAIIKAIISLESGKFGGFFADGRPVILFEAHVMWQRLRAYGINPVPLQAENPTILSSFWNRALYSIPAWKEHNRLEQAKKLHKAAAIESTSWGLFQIMGFHWARLGYKSAEDFEEKMYISENTQFEAFAKFLETSGVLPAMRSLDFERIALIYNGAGFRQNNYHNKLKIAYENAKKS